jgi:hypothetical protein
MRDAINYALVAVFVLIMFADAVRLLEGVLR